MARRVIDTHAHSLRFKPGLLKEDKEWNYSTLQEKIYTTQPWDNSPSLLKDMEYNHVDKVLISSAFNMRNEMIRQQVQEHPDEFIGLCWHPETTKKTYNGEAKFSAEAAAEEIESFLEYPEFVGIGEMLLFPDPDILLPAEENFRKLFPIMEVAKKHKAPILFHTGWIAYPAVRLRSADPVWIDDLAILYPEVPLIIGHFGVQAGWYKTFPEIALMVAARHKNVYLETSQATAEQIERAYLDPHIGPKKILFGSDYGTSISYTRVGDKTIATTNVPPTYLPDHFGWNLRQIDKIEMSEDDRNLILGLNAEKLFKI